MRYSKGSGRTRQLPDTFLPQNGSFMINKTLNAPITSDVNVLYHSPKCFLPFQPASFIHHDPSHPLYRLLHPPNAHQRSCRPDLPFARRDSITVTKATILLASPNNNPPAPSTDKSNTMDTRPASCGQSHRYIPLFCKELLIALPARYSKHECTSQATRALLTYTCATTTSTPPTQRKETPLTPCHAMPYRANRVLETQEICQAQPAHK